MGWQHFKVHTLETVSKMNNISNFHLFTHNAHGFLIGYPYIIYFCIYFTKVSTISIKNWLTGWIFFVNLKSGQSGKEPCYLRLAYFTLDLISSTPLNPNTQTFWNNIWAIRNSVHIKQQERQQYQWQISNKKNFAPEKNAIKLFQSTSSWDIRVTS